MTERQPHFGRLETGQVHRSMLLGVAEGAAGHAHLPDTRNVGRHRSRRLRRGSKTRVSTHKDTRFGRSENCFTKPCSGH